MWLCLTTFQILSCVSSRGATGSVSIAAHTLAPRLSLDSVRANLQANIQHGSTFENLVGVMTLDNVVRTISTPHESQKSLGCDDATIPLEPSAFLILALGGFLDTESHFTACITIRAPPPIGRHRQISAATSFLSSRSHNIIAGPDMGLSI